MDGKKKIPGCVRLACGWALLCACDPVNSDRVSDRPIDHAPVLFVVRLHAATSVLGCGCVELTDTEAAYFTALWIGTLWCAGSQATAAALALLLPGRPRWVSRQLAHLAAAVACAGHSMYHGAMHILRPGGYFAVASLVFVVGDIICSLAFYLGGEE